MAATMTRPESAPTTPPTAPTPTPPRRPSLLGRLAAFVAKAFLGSLALVLAVVAVIALSPWSLPNPFASTRTVHDHGVVLAELDDLSRYVAASGSFNAVVDLEDDAEYLPDFLKGERTIFLAEGEVEAYVEVGGLTEDGLAVSEDGESLVVTLPSPQLTEPRLDPDRTEVISRDRGLFDRVGDALTSGDPTNDDVLYQLADDQIAEAAAASDLRQRAEDNTEAFVTSLFEGVGYDDVTVRFVDPADQL